MAKLYVGGLPPGIPEFDLEREFGRFGRCKVWVARKPPGFGFVEYEDPRDGDDAVRALDGFHGWRVEISRGPRGSRGPPPPPIRYHDPPPMYGYRHSPPPRPYYYSPPPPRDWLPPPHSYRGRERSYSPTHRSRRHRSRSEERGRSRHDRSRERERRRRSPSPARRRSRSNSGDHKRSSSRDRTNNHSPSPAAAGAKVTDSAADPSHAGDGDVSDDQHSGGEHQRSRSPSPGSDYSGGRSDRSRTNSSA